MESLEMPDISSNRKGISSFTLHIIAMVIMLGDHLWATMLPWMEWLTCVGRIAFPIFAFMIVEGYFHTGNVKKYIFRMFIFAVISEMPFNLIMGSSWFFPYHQNVLWVFLFGLLLIWLVDSVKKKGQLGLTILVSTVAVILAYIIGIVGMLDYNHIGVLTVLVFYFFHGKKWWCLAGQLICLWYMNFEMLGGYYYDVVLGPLSFEMPQQGIAIFSLIPIWLYDGRQGYHAKWFKYFCYCFYPVHLLVLYIVWHLFS